MTGSNHHTRIGILGGSGFVGSHLSAALAASGRDVVVFSRARNRARHLWPLPNTTVVGVDVNDANALAAVLPGCDALINLVGILNEPRHNGSGFHHAHVSLNATALRASVAAGVSRYIYVSALGADPFGPSNYLRSKGEAEKVILDADAPIHSTIVRPSLMFGPGDSLFNRFARLLRLSPVLPLAAATTKAQPVYVGDVVAAIVKILSSGTANGEIFELGGPEVWTLRDIVAYAGEVSGHRRPIWVLGHRLSRLLARTSEWLPEKPFSRDNLASLSVDNVCRDRDGFTALGITPRSVRSIVPTYLGTQTPRSRYADLRRRAHR